MAEQFLYQQLDSVSDMGMLKRELPDHLTVNLNPGFELRLYQVEAFARFLHCVANDYPGKQWPLHFAFNRRKNHSNCSLTPSKSGATASGLS